MSHTPDTRTGFHTDSLLAIANQGLAISSPTMTLNEICELCIAMIRVPELLELAAADVKPEHFDITDTNEQQMHVVWDAVLELRDNNGAVPTVEAVRNELNIRLELSGQNGDVAGPAIVAALAENGFLSPLVNTNNTEGSLAHYRSLLHRFLRERDVIEPIVRIVGASCSASWNGTRTLPENMGGLLSRASERLEEIDMRFGNGEAWGDPIPLSDPDMPAFPMDALPPTIRQWVSEVAIASQTPNELAAMTAIGTCSAALAKKIKVHPWGTWMEPVNIYAVCVLPPANRKSAVSDLGTAPLREYERELIERDRHLVRDYERQERVLSQLKKKIEDAAAKMEIASERNARLADAANVDLDLDNLCRVVEAKHFIDDCTAEEVEKVLERQGGKIAVFSAEGTIFTNMKGHYNKGAAKFDVFLKGHTGEELRTDRIGRDSIYVSDPAITIVLSVQPEVIRGLGDDGELRGKGLLGRFLYFMPQSLLGRRQARPSPVSDDTVTAYHRLVRDLCHVPDREEPQILSLSPDAQERLERFMNSIEPQFAPWGELAGISDWAGKLAGAVLRLSGILHTVEQAEAHHNENIRSREQGQRLRQRDSVFRIADVEISVATLESAIMIGEYLIPHAQAAFRLMGMASTGAPSVLPDAWHVVGWIQRSGHRVLTKRDIHVGNRSRFPKAIEVDPVLELLVDHNFIRSVNTETYKPKAGRRPSEKYQVNPRVFDADFRALIPEQ